MNTTLLKTNSQKNKKEIMQALLKDGWTLVEGCGFKRLVKIHNVTFEESEEWLENGVPNRSPRHDSIRRFAKAMEEDRYHGVNGETIIFNEFFQVMDGRNRLKAIVLTQKPQVCFLIANVPTEHFATIDTGRSRSLGDVFQAKGIRNAMLLSRTSKLVLIWDTKREELLERGSFNKEIMDIQPQSVWNFYNSLKEGETYTNASEIDVACERFKRQSPIIKACGGTVLSFVFLVLRRMDASKCYEFFENLFSERTPAGWEIMEHFRSDLLDETKVRLKEGERISYLFCLWNSIYFNAPFLENLKKPLNLPYE